MNSTGAPDNQSGKNINIVLQEMAFKTKEFLAAGNTLMAKNLIGLAAKIYDNGDDMTRNLVSNVYVFSIATYIELHDMGLLELLPQCLKDEFYEIVGAQAK